MQGFATAGGKSVSISEKALAAARRLLADSDEEADTRDSPGLHKDYHCEESHGNNAFAGFTSGSGKIVPVSEEALARARKLLGDEDSPTQSQTLQFTKPLPPDRRLFPSDEIRETSSFQTEFRGNKLSDGLIPKLEVGFSTGSGGKTIQVSEAALKRARLLFSDDCDSDADKGTVESTEKTRKGLFSQESSGGPSQTPAPVKSNSSSCSLKLLTKAPIKPKNPQPKITSLKRHRPDLGSQLFITPKPLSIRPAAEPSTKRIHQKPTQEPKPHMREYLDCHTLQRKAKFGKYAAIRPFKYTESDELVSFWESIKSNSGLESGKKVDSDWIDSQLRLILWKFVSYSQLFPGFDSLLSVFSISQELNRRYNKEILQGHRSAVSQLLDRDALPGSRLVLLIGEIEYEMETFKVEISDGWHSIWTNISENDSIGRLFLQRKLRTGVKIEVCNSLLSESTLKLSLNSLRLAKWDACLGLSRYQVPFRVSIPSILPDSGTVASIEGYIVKRYPVKFYIPAHKKTYSKQAVEEMELGRDIQVRAACLLRLKDALPGGIGECYVTVERTNVEHWEGMKEGIALRCVGLEISRYRPSHNGLMHLITHISYIIPRKQTTIPSIPPQKCTESTVPDTECFALGCILHIDCTCSSEILRVHILTTENTVSEVKIHSHPFFGSKLTRVKATYTTQLQFVLFTNCVRDFEPVGTLVAACTTDESELFTYIQTSHKTDLDALKTLMGTETPSVRFEAHKKECRKGKCHCGGVSS